MDEDHKLTKDEKKALRKIEWQEKERSETRNAKIKKISTWIGAILVILIVVFVLFESITTPTTPTQTIKIAPVSARDIKTGNPKAKVTLLEYADFQCSACAVYHPIVNQLLSAYGNKINYVFRMFPLVNAHPNALTSAQAAYAAYKQNAFFAYGDILFNKQTEWSELQDPTTAFTESGRAAATPRLESVPTKKFPTCFI